MKGFTLIELVVSVAIFAFMTALVISKYGTFNQNTLLINVAYDMALTVRTAQSYGLSVKSVDGSNSFSAPYGVHFDMNDNTHFKLFADINSNYKYDSTNGLTRDESITTYALNSGAKISSICLGSVDYDCTGPNDKRLTTGSASIIDVTYKRPNPDAQFYCNGPGGTNNCGINTIPVTLSSQPIVFITVTSSDNSNSQVIAIRKNGQISVGKQ